jgi:hypothetical protein
VIPQLASVDDGFWSVASCGGGSSFDGGGSSSGGGASGDW